MTYIDKRKQIDQLQQKINSHGELNAEVKKKINYKFRLDWNYYSNSMEGNTLTMDETRSVMVGNLTVGGKPIKDVLEMKGHDEVIAEILKIGKGETKLSEARIKAIHKGIMHEEDEKKKEKIGVWKTAPNHVINYKGEKFEFAPPTEVPERMHQLLDKTNAAIDAIKQNKKDALHPVDIALQFHLEYVSIHPFYDGNGRTARILTNLLLIAFGYPPFWVKTNERSAYNQYIADIQGYGGKPDLFFEYAANLILRSQQLVIDAIEGKIIEEVEDIDKEVAMFKKELKAKESKVMPRSDAQIYKLYENGIKQMFELYIEKMNQFDDLFTAKEVMGWVNNGNLDHLGLEHINNEMIRWYSKALVLRPGEVVPSNSDVGNFKMISVNINFEGFKNDDLNTFSISNSVHIEFGPFVYVIGIYGRQIKSNHYSDFLSPELTRNIVNSAVKETMEEIKARIDENNNVNGTRK